MTCMTCTTCTTIYYLYSMPVITSKTRVSFSVTNCICFDQRVLKTAGTLRILDCDITIIGRRLGKCCDSDSIPFSTKRFRMLFRKTFLFYMFFNIRLFFYLLFNKFELLVANDLDTLLPNYLVSKLKRVNLVYDSHEYFTGVPELNDRALVKWVWKTIEKRIFPHIKYAMTVSDLVAKQYEMEYGLKPVVIRNCSPGSTDIKPYSRHEIGIGDDDLLLILQGGGINIDKGAEELIEAVRVTEKVSLLIAGSGDVLPVLKKKTANLHLSDRIKFFPKMPWEDMMRYMRCADAGLCIEKDTNLNYRFSLPNKLFDYISAGIAVINSGVPEVKKIIDEYGCGLIIPAVTPEEISRAIIRLRDDRTLLNKLKQSAVSASEKLNWETESLKVIEFYNEILPLCSL
jgi:glycosyltransferase involved in cell wall biosynthesis